MSEQRVDMPNHAEWSVNTIESFCEIVSRGKGPRYVESSNVSAIGQRCVTDRGFNESRTRPHDEQSMGGHLIPKNGDILLNSTGTGTIGRTSIFNGHGKFIVDSHVTVLRPQKIGINSKWLNELFKTAWFKKHLEAKCYTGSTNQVELSRAHLIKTSVPTPLYEEQSLIARILDTLDTQIEKTEALIAKLEKVKEGLLHDLLTRGIDEDGHLRPSPDQAPELYKESPLGAIPLKWRLNRIGDIAKLQGGFAFPSGEFGRGNIPVIRMSNLEKGHLDLTGVAKVSARYLEQLPNFMLHEGDLILGMTGSLDSWAVVLDEDTPAMLNQRVGRFINLNKETLNYRILDLFVTSRIYQNQVHQESAGAAQLNISSKQVEATEVPVPPLQEQEAIVERYSSLNDRIDKERRLIRGLIDQKTGLMDDLLTGHVRVIPLLERAQAITPA